MPSYISVGGGADGPGFLGMAYAPFTVQNAGTPPENIRPPQGMGNAAEAEERIRRRQRLFYTLEDQFTDSRPAPEQSQPKRNAPNSPTASKAHQDIYKKGFDLVASKEGKVFELGSEPAIAGGSVWQHQLRPGRLDGTPPRAKPASPRSKSTSAAGTLTNKLSRPTPPAYSRRSTRRWAPWSRTSSTAACGRTPSSCGWASSAARRRINQNSGRDHWARCWSVVVGGGAIKGGQVYGSTDQDGMDVANNPVKVGDVFATIYRGLGIDPTTQVRDAIGRPFAIAGGNGRPIEPLF